MSLQPGKQWFHVKIEMTFTIIKSDLKSPFQLPKIRVTNSKNPALKKPTKNNNSIWVKDFGV